MLGLLEQLVIALAVYLALGLAFAVPFVLAGVQRIDDAAAQTSPAFRIIIVPGVAMLWPLMLARWIRGRTSPDPIDRSHGREETA